MVVMSGPDIFDYLAKQTVAGTSQSNLHNSVKDTNVDRTNVRAWQDAIMIAKAIEDSRTFAHGLPIYDTGTAVSETLADGADATYGPSDTEIWLVQTVNMTNLSWAMRDSNGTISLLDTRQSDTSTCTIPPSPIFVTSSMKLFVSNSSGSSQTVQFSYYKVSL